jgi:hypothetical protein
VEGKSFQGFQFPTRTLTFGNLWKCPSFGHFHPRHIKKFPHNRVRGGNWKLLPVFTFCFRVWYHHLHAVLPRLGAARRVCWSTLDHRTEQNKNGRSGKPMDREFESKGHGFYYDWLQQRWIPRPPPRPRSPHEQRQHHRRTRLLRDLLNEFQDGDSASRLYAALLARTLVSADEDLMRAFGKEVSERCEAARPRTAA